ncbi:MAG: agmatinase [Proteobacteria bacterium]|nr:agmatinase [Pseudomonadota bacterium]
MTVLTTRPQSPYTTFFNFEFAPNLDELDAHFAIIGMPYGDPYDMDEMVNDQTRAPAAVRRASERITQALDRWDFDIGGTPFDGSATKVVDVGDIPGDPRKHSLHYALAEKAVRKILAAGAFPITIGGDHGVPIPVFRALSDHGPITLIHIDAHLDWRDEVNGVREGYSSTIRRASEMDHIHEIFQIGMRGSGSARAEEVQAARSYGAHIITDAELQERGIGAILDMIPNGGRYYLTIDADGLDPAVMPAVASPQPGGVTYTQTIRLIQGLCRKGTLVGMDIVEITPSCDLNNITCITAGHIIMNVIGAMVRAGHGR